MVGTLWGLLVPSMLVYKIWWPNRDKQLWEGRGEHEKEKNSIWLKCPNYFCLRLWLCNKCKWVALPFYKWSGAEMLDEASFLDTDLDTDIITVTDQGENGTTLNTSTSPDLLNAARQKNAKGMLLCHLNINSIQNKFDELKDTFINSKMKIMAVGETKIDRSYPDSQFLIPGYYLHQNDR